MSAPTRTSAGTAEPVATRPAAGRVALVLVVATLVAIGLNTVVATIAVNAGAERFPPLTLPVYGGFTVLGLLAGWAGWRLVQRRAARPSAVLRVLVPVVVLLSFVPDVALLTQRFIPGTTTAGVLALMTMHLVVATVGVTAFAVASRPS
jgi:hypothetical protein